MAIPAEAGVGQVSMGRVFSRAFSTISANPLVTLLIAFVVGAIPNTAISLLTVGTIFAAEDEGGSILILGIFSWIVSLAIVMLTQAALTRVTVAHSNDRNASLGECLRAGAAVLPQLMVLALLISLGVGIGMIVLIVPGVILYCMWAVATPALVEERPGILGSLGRSRQLTRGFRWRVFGITLILLVLYYLLLSVFTMFGAVAMDTEVLQGGVFSVGFLVYSVIVGTLTNVVWGTVQASLFVELREAREGPQHEQLEQVFA